MPSYTFDLKLNAALTIEAETGADARAMIEKAFGWHNADPANCNGGAWPDGSPILFEASLSERPSIGMIDGEDCHIQTAHEYADLAHKESQLTGYRGDMNLEEGGYFYRFTPGDDYADIVEVIAASDMGGPGNLFFISAGSLYMPDEKRADALACCGWEIDESDPVQIIDAFMAYMGIDSEPGGHAIIQIGKRDPYHDYDHGGFGMPADDAITFLGAKTDLRGYVLANHVSWE